MSQADSLAARLGRRLVPSPGLGQGSEYPDETGERLALLMRIPNQHIRRSGDEPDERHLPLAR